MGFNIKRFMSNNVREIALLGIIITLGILVNVRSGGDFLTAKNIRDMMSETSILVILTMGMMMVILTSGIDLSIASIMALSGMVGTITLKNFGFNPFVIICLAIIIGALAGFINGIVISVFKVLPIIATLGTMNAFRGITYLVSGGSWVLQQNMTESFMNVATGSLFGIDYLIWIAIFIILLTCYFLNCTRTGRKIYAIGNSEKSAIISGINVKKVITLTYILMGALAGLGGILYVCKYAAAQGETALGYEMNVIAACVLGGVSTIGGLGKVHGAVLGAILFGMLNNALPLLQISPFWQEGIRGTIILVSNQYQ
ncbi:MAG: ABC transporter permease [Lachnospirales bacterium]